MKASRRAFLAGTASLFISSTVTQAYSQNLNNNKLVVIILRGGMDGLAAVPFIGNDMLTQLRPDIYIPNPTKISGNFGLHPKLENFYNLWKSNNAKIVHATSIPYTERSHFEGQNLLESGGEVPYQHKTGWLGRALETTMGHGLSISLPMPLLLRGHHDLDNFLPSKRPLPTDNTLKVLAEDFHKDPKLSATLASIRGRSKNIMGASLATEPQNHRALARIAGEELQKIEGLGVAVFDIAGFDTHTDQGNSVGDHADQLSQFDQVIGELHRSLGEEFNRTMIVSLTEFGRTVAQNSGSGTEHGYGTAILMAGGLISRSGVVTDWPGLGKTNLFEGRDLLATIDARAVYASVVSRVFQEDYEKIVNRAFFDTNLPNMADRIFG